MTDLRPAQDVAAELVGACSLGIDWCYTHQVFGEKLNGAGDCPVMVHATAIVEADRKAAMAVAWGEGFTAGRRADHNPCWWPPNPSKAADG